MNGDAPLLFSDSSVPRYGYWCDEHQVEEADQGRALLARAEVLHVGSDVVAGLRIRVSSDDGEERWIALDMDQAEALREWLGIAKDDEPEVLERHGFGDVYKSGCIMCPYQGAGWFWVLRETEPERWAEVLAYETRALEKNPKLGGIVGGVPVAEAVERWRARNPSAGVEEVLSKSYSRCRTSKAQLPLFDLMARTA